MRPGDVEKQGCASKGYKKAQAFVILVFCDKWCSFLRVEIARESNASDLIKYIWTPIYQRRNDFPSESVN